MNAKLIFFAFVAALAVVTLVNADCTEEAKTKCAGEALACFLSATTNASRCECIEKAAACGKDAGCTAKNDANATAECKVAAAEYGCDADKLCSSASTSVVALPIALFALAVACFNKF